MAKKENNQKKSEEERKFQKELNKLKLSAEYGLPFSEEKEQESQSDEADEDYLSRLKEFEKAMRNPDETKITDLLGSPKFPKEKDLTDNEVSAALELAKTALANKNIVLDVIYPTPDRKIYRFITEELMKKGSGMAGAGGMTMHFIYEEFYPNHTAEIKEAVTDTLHFICCGYKGNLPWRIAREVSLYDELLPQEEFEAMMNSYRHVFKGISFVSVDSITVTLTKTKAHAEATFRYYLDQSSETPGEETAEADFYFEFNDNMYLINRLVIKQFGIM